jgi:hypothetical protein
MRLLSISKALELLRCQNCKVLPSRFNTSVTWLMLYQLKIITESGYHWGKALEQISGVNLKERLAMKNQKLDILEKSFMARKEP